MGSATRTATRKGVESVRQTGRGALFLLPVAVLSVGHVIHTYVATSPFSAAWTAAFLCLGGVALTVLTWQYARPRSPLVQWHASVTSGLVAVQLFGLLVVGVSWPSTWTVLGLSGLLAVTWTVRRMPAIRGEGDESGQGGDVASKLGLSVKRTKIIESTPQRAVSKWNLGDGQTAETVQSVLPAIGSHLGTVRKGVRVAPGEREGQVTVTAIYEDVLKGTLVWPGPRLAGASIADGFCLGMYEDWQPVMLYPAGNYAKGIAPGHTGQQGMPRSGKGVQAHVFLAELSTRRDVARVILADTRKGRQFTGPIEDAIGWYWDTDHQIKAGLKAVERAVSARNKALGDAGHNSWTPAAYDELGMPALVLWLEEAAAYVLDFQRLLVGLAEACLSAGVFIVVSSQLWKHDRVPTSLRSNVSNVLVFGCAESADASYLLSDSTIANGGDPGEWKARFPGRFLCEANGVDPGRFPLNAKQFFATNDELSAVTSEYGPRMAAYDQVTLDAFGEAFVPYVGTQGDESKDDESFFEDDDEFPEDEEMVVPKMDDEEMDAAMANIDPRMPVPDVPGVAGVDLTPLPVRGAQAWTKTQKEQAFGLLLLRLAQANRWEVTTAELYDEWADAVGERETLAPWLMHELVNVWIEHGQMERTKQGTYRLTTLVTQGS